MQQPIQTPQGVLAYCRERDAKAVDLRFTDLLGQWHHATLPASMLSEDLFEDGFGFDGSSIRGWRAIHESDMLLVPRPETAFFDPFASVPTLNLICTIQDPITREDYARDPRNVARAAVSYLFSTGIGDAAYFGPELEFFVFDDVRFDARPDSSFYSVDSTEAAWNRGRDEGPNLGHKIRHKEGYVPCSPLDRLGDIRTEMMTAMQSCQMEVECLHHEVATAGQCEIDLRYDSLLEMADAVMKYKYIVRNVALRNGKTATFMPKPIFGDNGSGMHIHFSLWKDSQPLFAGGGYAGLSDLGLHAIGGLLAHAGSLCAFTNPTTNSYRRLVPGYEAPVNLAYSQRNRSAACRIPMYNSSPKSKRIEFRCPDPTANPYLAFSAMLLAAIDGIQNKIDPGDPLDKNIYDLPPEMLRDVAKTPANLESALDALEADHDYLLRGDVFPRELIEGFIDYKRVHEVAPMRLPPHPLEFCMYYDA